MVLMVRTYLLLHHKKKGSKMLDANKYIDRLRVIVKSSDEVEKHLDKANFLLYRLKDLIRDYDRDFDDALDTVRKYQDL